MGRLAAGAGTVVAMLSGAVAAQQPDSAGEQAYARHCVTCHQPGGSGMPGIAPPLANALRSHLAGADARRYFSQIVVTGMVGPIVVQGQPYNGLMPAFAQVSDDDLAATLDYVLAGLNGADLPPDFAPISAREIAAARASGARAGDTYRLRRQLLGSGK